MSDEGAKLSSSEDGENLVQVQTGQGVEQQQQNLSSVRSQKSTCILQFRTYNYRQCINYK